MKNAGLSFEIVLDNSLCKCADQGTDGFVNRLARAVETHGLDFAHGLRHSIGKADAPSLDLVE